MRATAIGRVLGRRSMQNRYFRAGVSGVTAAARGTARATRVLWLEVTGFLCAAFAVSVGGGVWREWRQQAARRAEFHGDWKVAVGSGVALLFVWFALSNFWRARRVKREAANPGVAQKQSRPALGGAR